MSICPRCGNEFATPSNGYQRKFCSRSCANARTFTEKANKSRAKKVAAWRKANPFDYEKNKEAIKARAESYSANKLAELLACDFNTIKNHATRRKRLLIEQDYKCLECGVNEWQGQPLPLEMDHIDGNNKNNTRDNLRMLCPNCHALTPTWRGRKILVL